MKRFRFRITASKDQLNAIGLYGMDIKKEYTTCAGIPHNERIFFTMNKKTCWIYKKWISVVSGVSGHPLTRIFAPDKNVDS